MEVAQRWRRDAKSTESSDRKSCHFNSFPDTTLVKSSSLPHVGNSPSAWNRCQLFESIFIRTSNENSVLTLEGPEKRESESSGPIFRTDGRNLEGFVRETEISLQTESAAVWAGDRRKA